MNIDAISRKNPSGLRLILLSTVFFNVAPGAFAQSLDANSDEIVVTATRRESSLSTVPVSVAAFSQELMQKQGVKQVDDLIRITPGLNLTRAPSGANNISVRGISSTAGAATTGVYIDDTPIQVRNLEYGSGTLFPVIFDLERVEVLRGPQGTLFGAGSEGGTIRFIQPEPNLTDFSAYARSELATTQNGGTGYEAGVALGGPIITDKLAVRGSIFFRRTGGYIDRVTGTFALAQPTLPADAQLALREKSSIFTESGTTYANSNWTETTAGRLALKAALSDNLEITPAVSYQNQFIHDNSEMFIPSASDRASRDFRIPVYQAGAPTAPGTVNGLTALDAPTYERGRDRFVLPSLKVEYDLGFAEITSNSAYLSRKKSQWDDFTQGYALAYTGEQFPSPGRRGAAHYNDQQKNFVQELRVQSSGDNRLNWIVGGFYSHAKQKSESFIGINFLYDSDAFGPPDGEPFGPGYNGFVNYFGTGLLPNSGTYAVRANTVDEQLAAFGQLDFKFTDGLTLTLGARYSGNKFRYDAAFSGPENVLNAPANVACVPGSDPCVVVPVGQFAPGEGPFASRFAAGNAATSQNVFTPKVSVSWQADSNNLVYASASKGYRPGGGQLALPSVCDAGLPQIGYTTRAGTNPTPLTYGSDSVWSYELGSKNKLFNGLLRLDGSAYLIKWKKVQASITVPVCGYTLTDNLGGATARGFDLSIDLRPSRNLTIGTSIGYNKTTFDSTTPAYPGDSPVPNTGAPWNIYVYGEYTVPLAGTNELYGRIDYTFTSSYRRFGLTDPNNAVYDPNLDPRPNTKLVNGRVGVRLDDSFDVSLFANNLLNSAPHLSLAHSQPGSLYWRDSTFVPRTIGLTASFRR